MVLWLTTCVTWLLVSCYLVATNIILISLVTTVIYFFGPFFEMSLRTCTNVGVPDALRGRVSSLLRVVELGSYSLGFFVTGLLLEYAGSVVTIACLAGIMLVLTLFAKLNRSFHAL